MMQSYDVKIRKAEEKDVESVLSILLRLKRFNSEFDCFCRVSEKDMDEIRSYVKKIINDEEGHVILLAEDREKTVGILIA
ncbi:MAG: GNAT family N-acetyltransferase, partial [Thermoplasmata archaeon]